MYGSVVENVYGMKIKQMANGNVQWLLDLTDNEDTRTWASDKYYWLPIARTELNKAPNLQPQPGY